MSTVPPVTNDAAAAASSSTATSSGTAFASAVSSELAVQGVDMLITAVFPQVIQRSQQMIQDAISDGESGDS